MPTVFYKKCDPYQGYNFRKDKSTPVGFITAIKIGDTDLDADQSVEDPETTGSSLSVVSILTKVEWGLAPTDPLAFGGYLTAGNKQTLQTMTFKDLTKINVDFTMKIYDYDPRKTSFYVCMEESSKSTLYGLVEKNGDDLVLSVDDTESGPVESPKIYHFSIGIKPKSTAQSITIGTGVSSTIVKAWGIEETTS